MMYNLIVIDFYSLIGSRENILLDLSITPNNFFNKFEYNYCILKSLKYFSYIPDFINITNILSILNYIYIK